jgi:hypothetical protein
VHFLNDTHFEIDKKLFHFADIGNFPHHVPTKKKNNSAQTCGVTKKVKEREEKISFHD